MRGRDTAIMGGGEREVGDNFGGGKDKRNEMRDKKTEKIKI